VLEANVGGGITARPAPRTMVVLAGTGWPWAARGQAERSALPGHGLGRGQEGVVAAAARRRQRDSATTARVARWMGTCGRAHGE
jgi:hypothetical protein